MGFNSHPRMFLRWPNALEISFPVVRHLKFTKSTKIDKNKHVEVTPLNKYYYPVPSLHGAGSGINV